MVTISRQPNGIFPSGPMRDRCRDERQDVEGKPCRPPHSQYRHQRAATEWAQECEWEPSADNAPWRRAGLDLIGAPSTASRRISRGTSIGFVNRLIPRNALNHALGRILATSAQQAVKHLRIARA